MIDLKTSTYEQLCAERDRVARAISIPGGYVDPAYINALDSAIYQKTAKTVGAEYQ